MSFSFYSLYAYTSSHIAFQSPTLLYKPQDFPQLIPAIIAFSKQEVPLSNVEAIFEYTLDNGQVTVRVNTIMMLTTLIFSNSLLLILNVSTMAQHHLRAFLKRSRLFPIQSRRFPRHGQIDSSTSQAIVRPTELVGQKAQMIFLLSGK